MQEEQIDFEFLGEIPEIPVWEKTVEEIITEEPERSDFYDDLLDGFI